MCIHKYLSGLKITALRTFCPIGKTQGKIACSTRLCFCPTINWRCPTKLLILSYKDLSNKSFLINKLQYTNYSFFTETHIKRLYRNITLSCSFLHHHLQTKIHWLQNNLIFSICEQFLIPLKEAGMKLTIFDLLEHWYVLVYMQRRFFLSREFRI